MTEQFVSLLQDFIRHTGLPAQASAVGVTWSCETFTVCVLPHPRREEQLIVDAEVGPMDPEVPNREALLLLLHQVNDAARFEHDWFITIDGESKLRVQCTREVGRTTAVDLEALLVECVDRAEALDALITAWNHDTPPAWSPTQPQNRFDLA